MSDYDYRNDPLRRDAPYDPVAGDTNTIWGWIAAAVFIVVVLAFAFGVGHEPGQRTASNDDVSPPPATRMAPPPAMAPITPAPITPAPNAPANRGTPPQ
jgi:hypothetical protein